MAKKLSILICSLEKRHNLLARLMESLEPQLTPQVEVLTEIDDGRMKIGHKRNLLLKGAQGDYISFIDDDDLISDRYVPLVLDAVESSPDCCGIRGIVKRRNQYKREFRHSILYSSWYEYQGIYYRCPNHLNPVKRELALKVKFANISKGEDKDYSLRLYPLLKSEFFIGTILYYYLTG